MTADANTITPVQGCEEKGSAKKKLLGAKSNARLSDSERNVYNNLQPTGHRLRRQDRTGIKEEK
eukprot:Pgem_evm1s3963